MLSIQKPQRLNIKYLMQQVLLLPPEFKRLAKINFDTIMKETTEFLASKSQVDNFLDKSGKTRAKIKNL